MGFTTVEMARARDISRSLLEGLGLDAYLFEVEPREDYWELKVECANEVDGSWTAKSVHIADGLLMGAAADGEKKEQLLEFLHRELSVCKRITL